MDAIKWQLLPVSEFHTIHSQWDALNQRTLNQGVLSALFMQSLINTFAAQPLYILCKYERAQLTFAGIFEQRSNYRWAIFQTSQGPLGAILSESHTLDRRLFADIHQHLPGTQLLFDFTQLDSAWFEQSDGVDCLPYITTGSLRVPEDFDAYFASLSKNTRQNINKAKNRLNKEGVAIELSIVTQPEQIKAHIAQYGELESKGWKSSLGTAVDIANEQGAFYVEMMTSFAEQGLAQIWCYKFNGAIVAVDLCIVHDDTITILKTTFDENFARYSPALLMKVDAYKAMSEQGNIKRIEYYGKVMDWHRRLACEERALFHVTWAKNQTLYRSLNWLKNKINKHPKVKEVN
ncbi:GNAT family N-acetyltransferase [Thalassotalea euphylliae]|uniref:GNAT family N-acetyltransferase n=1 Tax=Thalassotalea euphylliae TaxID=1655234 RepID=A0A3E0TLJ6_9GAMM|nr:GNAT family N-acetyltransferase [Thalassotalea euphylliae]REL25217.1 GNAT family N-acetyltransferase [Thalassotalea euphylliae]